MAAHRYWRLSFNATAGNAYAFAEVQFRTTAGTPLLFSGGTASAAETFSSTYAASMAADNNPATLWSANDANLPQWWAYDYGVGVALDIVEATITARNDGSYTQAPSNFSLQWSDDNSAWTGIATWITTWTAAGQTQIFNFANALPAHAALVTQSSLEQFVSGGVNAFGQVTQVALEMWASASSATPEQMLVTQVSLEMWVLNTPPPYYQARVQVMA